MSEYTPVRAARGTAISCKGWQQEGALRMLMNNLDEEVAENPRKLIVYGGSGRAARSWDAFHAILGALQSGKRRDVTNSVGKARWNVSNVSSFPSRTDCECEPGTSLGDARRIQPPRSTSTHDVRADDCGKLDLYRHSRHRARNI